MRALLLPPVDRAFSALLEDLDQRNLLSETLVELASPAGTDVADQP